MIETVLPRQAPWTDLSAPVAMITGCMPPLLVVRFQRKSPINDRDHGTLYHRQEKHPIESHH
jgi:hypothetical protein